MFFPKSAPLKNSGVVVSPLVYPHEHSRQRPQLSQIYIIQWYINKQVTCKVQNFLMNAHVARFAKVCMFKLISQNFMQNVFSQMMHDANKSFLID